ncbi:hypothetical protein ABIA31_007525 [Catenulispora sp. MAP5-51]|uniref:hypothetical protein n=1 Tax=Catenulispora sp. MAP5-51 TaxID=3156298 RepID=UPI003512AF8D
MARDQASGQRRQGRGGHGSPKAKLPKLGQKEASASTWIEGTAETLAVLAVTAGGYRFSGKLARRRIAQALPTEVTATALPAEA